MERLLNGVEAAEVLGLSRNTINVWVSQKKIPYVKLGRRVLFKISDLQAWIDANVIKPKGEKNLCLTDKP